MMDRKTLEQMGQDCMDLITKKVSKQIGGGEFYAGLIELDRKYPMQVHNPPLTPFQLKNYRSIKMTIKNPALDVVYEDHLYPFNFQEAGEMFIRYQQKLDEECLPLEAWKKKDWPLTERLGKFVPELEGIEAEEFERKRENIKQQYHLPYKDNEAPF